MNRPTYSIRYDTASRFKARGVAVWVLQPAFAEREQLLSEGNSKHGLRGKRRATLPGSGRIRQHQLHHRRLVHHAFFLSQDLPLALSFNRQVGVQIDSRHVPDLCVSVTRPRERIPERYGDLP
jgi:hypothetical protein